MADNQHRPIEVTHLTQTFGPSADNRLAESVSMRIDGAVASLETFYYALNGRDLTVFKAIWYDDRLVQLDNPVGGTVRGLEPTTSLYEAIFNGPVRVTAELGDVVQYASNDVVIFAGRERGAYEHEGARVPLDIRTSRMFGYASHQRAWRQIHHHGSIDDAEALAAYQQAVRRT